MHDAIEIVGGILRGLSLGFVMFVAAVLFLRCLTREPVRPSSIRSKPSGDRSSRCTCKVPGQVIDIDVADTFKGESYTIRKVCGVCWEPVGTFPDVAPLPGIAPAAPAAEPQDARRRYGDV